MPELPEIETLRRSLAPRLVGALVRQVDILRPDVVAARRVAERALLAGGTIDRLDRLGKHLAVIAEDGRALDIHLGMSGSLTIGSPNVSRAPHEHVRWTLRDPAGALLVLRFVDPRRFGGIHAFDSDRAMRATRWSDLGPDALGIQAAELIGALAGTRTPIKAALLDQARLAGVGNIYADEALFRAGIRPTRPAGRLAAAEVHRLAAAVRQVLREGVAAGGSTIRDYVDGEGKAGGFQVLHRVYGRAGKPCMACAGRLVHCRLGQRSTTFCPRCQPARTKPSTRGRSLIHRAS